MVERGKSTVEDVEEVVYVLLLAVVHLGGFPPPPAQMVKRGMSTVEDVEEVVYVLLLAVVHLDDFDAATLKVSVMQLQLPDLTDQPQESCGFQEQVAELCFLHSSETCAYLCLYDAYSLHK